MAEDEAWRHHTDATVGGDVTEPLGRAVETCPRWSVIGPWMGRRVKRRTAQVLDTLVRNASFG